MSSAAPVAEASTFLIESFPTENLAVSSAVVVVALYPAAVVTAPAASRMTAETSAKPSAALSPVTHVSREAF